MNRMIRNLFGLLLLLALAGCATRSISNSGPPGSDQSENPFYHGELTQFQVIGVDPRLPVSENEIAQTLAAASDIRLSHDEPVMVVQSGASIPDATMLKALSGYFKIGVFSGIPPQGHVSAVNYARSLRLAAAKGGYKVILVYWGLLESGSKAHDARVISWVPLIGWSINDETELMRIRLKIALIDVRTGDWKLFTPPPFAASKDSDFFTRDTADQGLVQQLKAKAYATAAKQLYQAFEGRQ